MSKTDCFLSHNWGDKPLYINHQKVGIINDELRKRGFTTWYDAQQMHGQIARKMAKGIDNTEVFLVFVTEEYQAKVNGNNAADNCLLEFEHAANVKTKARMMPIIIEESMLDTRKWTDLFNFYCGGKMYIDMTGDVNNAEYLAEQVSRLCEELEEDMGISPSKHAATASNTTTPASKHLSVTYTTLASNNKDYIGRYEHIMFKHDNNLFVYGGYPTAADAIWKYKFDEDAWEHHQTTGENPKFVEGLGWFMVQEELYIFGGSSPWLDQFTNKTYCLNLGTFQWSDCSRKVKGVYPSPRSDFAFWQKEKQFIVFGGIGSKIWFPSKGKYKDGFNNQLFTLNYTDTYNMLWEQPSFTGCAPTPRYRCAYTQVGHTGYLFGGLSATNCVTNDLYCLNLSTFIWTEVSHTTLVPPERYGSTMSCVNNTHLFVCGGRGEDRALDDAWLFNIAKCSWEKVNCKFAGRKSHTSCTHNDKEVFVFGGSEGYEFLNELGMFTSTFADP